ncbi:MAG: hypothetical protein LBR53_11450 [Deltaproteobacteria bacterium]|nr:hypothetical protein [Deltaproteobacteria bacterium]
MATTKKDVFFALVYGLLGLFFIETGILSLYMALAHAHARGSPVAALAGALQVFFGAALAVHAKRRLFRKE